MYELGNLGFVMKIDKSFIDSLKGSLFKSQLNGESQEIIELFDMINTSKPQENEVDLEEITVFVNEIAKEDDGDGEISETEIKNYIKKHESQFENTGINASHIKRFLNIFKNKAKTEDFPTVKYKKKDGKIVAKYEYDSSGKIIQRQNIKNGKLDSVTKYNDGIKAEIVDLFTYKHKYLDPNKDFDTVIDPIKQNAAPECWLLEGLSLLNKKSCGREGVASAVSKDKKNGNITVKFKHAYGPTKEFTITQEEKEKAKKATLGSKTKYSVGDYETVLSIELAVEKSRQEVGYNLTFGGFTKEVIALFTDIEKYTYIRNDDVEYPRPVLMENGSAGKKWYDDVTEKLFLHIKTENRYCNSREIVSILNDIKNNPDRYIVSLILKLNGIIHAGQIVGFETIDGEDYIVYTHPVDEKAIIEEPLEEFVKTKLHSMEVVEFEDNQDYDIKVNAKPKSFNMGEKANRTNFTSAMTALALNPNNSFDIKQGENDYTVTIKDLPMKFRKSEIETARLSNWYSTKDDTATLLELATERYINKTRHKNTIDNLTHTNLEDVKIGDILNLFSEKELKKNLVLDLKTAANTDGYKFAVIKRSPDDKTYYTIKDIKPMPNGDYAVRIIQPEDTSIVVTLSRDEFRRTFTDIEIYN